MMPSTDTSTITSPSPSSHISTRKMLLGLAAVILLGVTIAACVSLATVNSGHVIKGMTCEGVDISGMSQKHIAQFFADQAQTRLQQKAVIITAGNKHYDITAKEIALQPDVEGAVQRAFGAGHSGSPLIDFITQIRTALLGQDVSLQASFQDDQLKNKLAAIVRQTTTSPQNAIVTIDAKGNVIHHDAVIGRKPDQQALYEAVVPLLKDMKTGRQVSLPAQETPPAVTDEDLKPIDTILGQYTTHYYPGNRGHNIGLAAGKLSGVLIRSNGDFSFNQTVGTRTSAAGFLTAGVIANGRADVGIGGGVCQVSTTLYVAALKAGLTATERSSHYSPSHYCPPGLDATVADGQLDLKLHNPLAHSVYLLSSANGHDLTIYILGTRADLNGNTLQLLTEGSTMHPSAYRLYLQNGKVIKSEYLHTDTYDNLR